MIVTEKYNDNLIYTYSDQGMMIKQIETGILYEGAIDIPGKYTYEETNIPIPTEESVEE